MKRIFWFVPAVCLALCVAGAAEAADPVAPRAGDVCNDYVGETGYSACDDPYNWCYGPGGWFGLAEMTFFRYHRADGARMGSTDPDEDVHFDFEASPRLTVGYMADDGLGARVRWWDYHHSASSTEGLGSALIVDTYTIDAEIFQTYCVCPCTQIIVSGGLRYNEFDEVMIDEGSVDFRSNSFDGCGGIIGGELWRSVSCHGALFASTRAAIMMDDKTVFNADGGNIGTNDVLRDSVQGMFEISLGYQYQRPLYNNTLFIARAAAEWQNWYNYSSAFNPDDEDEFAGPADVGFGGFVFGIGIMR